MTINIYNGSTYNTAQDLLVWNGTSWNSPSAVNIWTGTEWIDGLTTISLAGAVDVVSSHPGASEPSGASAVFGLYNDGYIYTGNYTTVQQILSTGNKWCNPTTHASNYEVLTTATGSTLDFGTLNTWTAINTNRAWRLTAHGTSGPLSDLTTNLTFSIRRKDTPKILATAVVTLSALTNNQ